MWVASFILLFIIIFSFYEAIPSLSLYFLMIYHNIFIFRKALFIDIVIVPQKSKSWPFWDRKYLWLRPKFPFILENKKAIVATFCQNFWGKTLINCCAPLFLPTPCHSGRRAAKKGRRLIKGRIPTVHPLLLREHAALIPRLNPNNQSICQSATGRTCCNWAF